jgi:mannan endo-1,4-beta-mannosidase
VSSQGSRRPWLSAGARLALMIIVIAAAVGIFLVLTNAPQRDSRGPLPVSAQSYLGVYLPGVPHSYEPVRAFTGATGVRPNVILYYSSWWEPFRAHFAATAARHGAIPLVQINPVDVSLAAIAAGKYDRYLDTYAAAVRAYRHPVIMGFGHEMNARWSDWGDQHASPAAFVSAWRHIVTVFRQQRVRNVTWLWTVNVIDLHAGSVNPGPWWPGDRYVTWVGIDGYYRRPSWRFGALFGPTIKVVRSLTREPILIAETGVAPSAGKAAKVGDLFAGVRAYGLLGLVWFDAVAHQDWRIDNPAVIAAFAKQAKAYPGPSG